MLVKINDVKNRKIIDTGASADILDEIALAHINQENNITLQPSSKWRLLAYRSINQLAVRGQFQSTISFQNQQCHTPLHAPEGDHRSLLSHKTATVLGIVNLQVSHIRALVYHRIPMKYPLFPGIGKLREWRSNYILTKG